jgi:hypothetical protein
MIVRHFRLFIVAAALIAAGCSHGNVVPSGGGQMVTPQSVSPAMIAPAPMAKTAILPSSEMRSPVQTANAVFPLSYTQLPGTATQVAASPDGSLWALSNLPSGGDKYIWHYASGTWTNISGLGAQIAVGPDGTLYVANAGGGVYRYSSDGNTWTALGGGASAITVGMDGSPYVLTNGAGADKALWEYCCGSTPNWGQLPGSGVSVAGAWDVGGPYTVSGGTIQNNTGSGGLYILNSGGAIWYLNDAHNTFANIAGSASAIAPTITGGLFVLGYPANVSGNNIYYYDLNGTSWATQAGSGVGISLGISNTGAKLYVVSSSGAIYSSFATTAWVLGGGSERISFTSSGGTLTISPADNTYTGSIVFGSNTARANYNTTLSWGTLAEAVGTFPPGALPSSIGTALLYIDVNESYVYPETVSSSGTFKTTFTQTPAVSVTTTGSFPGTHCSWAIYAVVGGGGGAATWNSSTAVGIAEVTPSGNTYTVPAASLPPGSTVDFYAGKDNYFALYCH